MPSILERFKTAFTDWLMREDPLEGLPLCDFERIQYELRPADVILIEGRSHISEIIKSVTQSAWSHAALYIGRLHDIDNPVLRQRVMDYYGTSPEDHLLVESLLGRGTVISPLANYRGSHIRICRPTGIARQDAQRVVGFAIGRLGMQYGIRHLFDLFRFLLPWGFLPRRWRSSLFEYHAGTPTHEICSFMIAEAFNSVDFPVLPLVKQSEQGVQFYRRNPKLFTPSDFDYSPYFSIIKYPLFELTTRAVYRDLPWHSTHYSNDEAGIVEPTQAVVENKEKKKTLKRLKRFLAQLSDEEDDDGVDKSSN